MSLNAALWLVLAVCVCHLDRCVCFPNGSVAFSCGHMLPVHPPYSAAASSPPFTVSASSSTYRPGGVITGESAGEQHPKKQTHTGGTCKLSSTFKICIK
uniref:Secreted protein n=1 Tax=Salarias fasciatus TaxID=181472 RepID=A0A672FZU6_SALFA